MAISKSKNRIMITLDDTSLERMQIVGERFMLTKSVIIQTLIRKYLEQEFGDPSNFKKNSTLLSQDPEV